ncbi:MAG: tyrosine-type recombinase/integrase [Gammaproteobacteria bacterium]|nr:tyrosine-type recombinase/integrase [Gammaproteobacteria bacterium]
MPLRNSGGGQMLPPSEMLQHYLQAATSDNTRKAYRSAIRQFEKWGGRLPSSADVIINYLMDKAQSVNSRTLDLHLTALGQWHHVQGITNPTRDPLVIKTMEGIRRIHGKPKRKAKALRLEHIAKMIEYLNQLPNTQKKLRDLAIILTGFFGAFRRSELVGITVEDLHWEPEGLIVQLSKSKTDQAGQGITRALPYAENQAVCPALAVKMWLESSSTSTGPLFKPINRWDQIQNRALNPNSINNLLKSIGKACAFDFIPDLSSHSFRRGLSTSAARERVDFELIKKHGGWKSDATVWGYIEEGQQFNNNASLILMEKMASMINSKS